MKIKLTLLALMLIYLGSLLNAQVLVKRKGDADSPETIYQNEIKEGDKTFNLKGLALSMALEHYLKAYTYNSKDPMLNYKIGVCYLNTINKVNSIPYLEKAVKLKPNISRDIHYLLGLAYQLNYEWDKAIVEYQKYSKNLTPDLKEIMTAEINKHIRECGVGKRLMLNPVPVQVENLGAIVNSSFPEYSPFLTADESKMFFTARKENTTGGDIDEQDYEYYEDIYISEKVNGKWSVPVNMGAPVNIETHDATAGISPDGQRLIVYRGDINGGDLFESKLQGSTWTKPVSLGRQINTDYHESSACYSRDQKTLFFVSDFPDSSYGGRDIYMSHLDEKGRWGIAENLGSVINTAYDEDGIFMHVDGKTLFFSSKGHETMGGYDIFWSKYNDSTKTWSKPKNLGYPINSPDDDIFFVYSADGKHGYYSSVKNDGNGEKDLIMLTFLEEKKELPDSVKHEIAINPITLVKGIVKDAKTLVPLQASVEIVDNFDIASRYSLQSNSQTGRFLVTLPSGKNYGIYVSSPGYLYHSENFDIPTSTKYQEVELVILLDKVEVGKKIVLRNIFYDFDKATLRPESVYELELIKKIMEEYPTMKIEISAHTDYIGTDQYNIWLSEARAKSVTDWLTAHGINMDRLVSKGYGESQPTATNETPEGRQLNRRSEFKILSK